MPVQETVDAIGQLEDLGLAIGSVVVNMVRRSPLSDDALTLAAKEKLPDLAAGLAAAGLPHDEQTASALAAEAHDHAVRIGLERENRARIDELDKPVSELGIVADGIDVGALFDLSEELAAELEGE